MPTARPQHRGKLAVSYGWASPVTRKRSAQSSRFQTLIKYFNLYCKHSSMMGLKYLVEDRATWTVRYAANITNMTSEEILQAIRSLGYLYDTDFRRQNNDTRISRLLSMFYGDFYNVMEIMEYLTPECSSLLMTCVLRGLQRNCSDIFSVSKTQDGFCCSFNYFSDDDYNKTYELAQDVGKDYGLIVTMDPMLDDYFFSMMPIIGFKVMVFRPRNYPDTLSGGVSELLVTPLTKRYVKLTALSLSSSDSIRIYPANIRKCIFADEIGTSRKAYTSSDCIVDCRIKDLWKFCKCRPFFYPDYILEEQNMRTCTVEDIPCVDKYKDGKRDVVPYKEGHLEHMIRRNTTLYCEICYPPCDDITYIVSTSTYFLKPERFRINSKIFRAHNNYSILHVFFAKGGTVSLRQDVTFKWFQYLSDIGGICELFLGCSLISCVEILYFIFGCLTELFTSDSDHEADEAAENQLAQSSTQDLYWNELFLPWRTTKLIKQPRNVI